MSETCIHPGCGMPPRRRAGYCGAHYTRKVRGKNMDAPIRRAGSDPERFWEKVQKTDSCWLWTGAKSSAGYGTFNLGDNRGYDYAHRVAYRLLAGPIPDGLVIDHLCRVRHCCNPDHLEPVDPAENVRRGLAPYGLRTECRHGHDIADTTNVYVQPGLTGHRCRACARMASATRYAAVKAAAHHLNMKVTHYMTAYGGSKRMAESVLRGEA